jgi:hypothetical protein
MSFSVPSGAVAGEPDVGDEVSFEEALVFAADLVGGLKYLMPPGCVQLRCKCQSMETTSQVSAECSAR